MDSDFSSELWVPVLLPLTIRVQRHSPIIQCYMLAPSTWNLAYCLCVKEVLGKKFMVHYKLGQEKIADLLTKPLPFNRLSLLWYMLKVTELPSVTHLELVASELRIQFNHLSSTEQDFFLHSWFSLLQQYSCRMLISLESFSVFRFLMLPQSKNIDFMLMSCNKTSFHHQSIQ